MNAKIITHNLENKNKLKASGENHEENEFLQRFIDFTAGSIAGGVQVIVSQPFDTVKVKEQTFPKMYKNMMECFMATYRNEGLLKGLYAGSAPAMIASISETAIMLAAYETSRRFVASFYNIENLDHLPIFAEALAGGLSALIPPFIVCPTELIKCRMQARNDLNDFMLKNRKLPPPPVSSSMRKLVQIIYFQDGFTGFYRGFIATLVRDIPGSFCFFGCYEFLKEIFKAPDELRSDVKPWITIFASGIAGIVLLTVTFPADVIKSRIQVNNLNGNILDVGKHIVEKNGFLALYHGLVPSLIRTIPATITIFVVYEFVRKELNQLINKKIKS